MKFRSGSSFKASTDCSTCPPVATVKLGNAYQFEKFGTKNRLLRYGIRIRCSKRLPPVRDAFSEAFGVKNRLLRYGRDIRYRKRPPTVRNRHSATKKGSCGARDAFSKARRTADSTDCGQLTVVRDAFSEACRAKSSTCRSGGNFSARNAHRSEVSKYKKRMTSKSIKTFWSSPFFYNNQSADYQKLNFSMACTR